MNEEEINFDKDVQSNELNANDFSGGNFIKNPAVNESIILDIISVQKSTDVRGKTKEGIEFVKGIKQKDGQVKRIDLHCIGGIYTISNWELYFKLFKSGEGLLLKYANSNNGSFAGAKIKITKLIDASYMQTKPADLAKILGKTIPEAIAVQDEIKKAIKEQRLYEVTLQ